MAKIEAKCDPRMIEAEETLLIDFQIAIQEIMAEKRITRSELAELAGLSKARLTQILSNEANPTVKSMARLFCALRERACVSHRPLDNDKCDVDTVEPSLEWHWDHAKLGEIRIDEPLVAVVKDTGASNDNYDDRFMVIDPHLAAA